MRKMESWRSTKMLEGDGDMGCSLKIGNDDAIVSDKRGVATTPQNGENKP